MTALYRADHVGSFLRPTEVLEARMKAAGDPIGLREVEDLHIQRVIAKQKDLGFEIATDGELRRRNFMSDFTDAVDGFDLGDSTARAWKAGEMKVAQVSSVTGIVIKELRQARSRDTKFRSCCPTALLLPKLPFRAPRNSQPSRSNRASLGKSTKITPRFCGPSSTS
jgi:hypothetical protein